MKTALFLRGCGNSLATLQRRSGAVRAARKFGWTIREITIGFTPRDFPRLDDAKTEFLNTYGKMREFWSPIGVIVDCGGSKPIFSAKELGLPTVFLDRNPEATGRTGVPCVFSDAKSFGQFAARELLALNARCHAYVPFMGNPVWSREREREFAKTLRLHGRICRIFRIGAADTGAGEFPRRLCEWIAALPKPAAVFAANDIAGELVIDAAKKGGFAVPRDVAVIGVDNEEQICLRTSPSLSSIKPDNEQAGFLAVSLLRDIIRHPERPCPPRAFGAIAVLHRGSTRTLHRHDERTMKIVEAIRRDATNGITVAQTAAGFGVSLRTLEMRFRQATGRSIRDELQSVRIEHAKSLLVQQSVRMSRVAAESGYPSLQAFRKSFTRLVGKSPKDWRKERLETTEDEIESSNRPNEKITGRRFGQA